MIKAKEIHPWLVSVNEAKQIQQSLSRRIITDKKIGPEDVDLIAGVDVHYDKESDLVRGAAVLWQIRELQVLESASFTLKSTFPYVPGYLAFREAPAVIRALEALKAEPDILMVEGQGIAHPRRFGLASHIGLLFDKPTLGVAKSRLFGNYCEPGLQKGDTRDLTTDSEIIGAVLRTRSNVKPVFVSVGHLIDLESAVELALRCTSKYRLPEPLRLAHILSRIS